MYNGADRDGQNGNPGLSGYGYATENTRPTSGGLRATAFVNPGCHSTASPVTSQAAGLQRSGPTSDFLPGSADETHKE